MSKVYNIHWFLQGWPCQFLWVNICKWYLTKCVQYITKTHVNGFFETDPHEVSWHFETHEAAGRVGFKVSTDRVRISLKEPIQNGFLFLYHRYNKITQKTLFYSQTSALVSTIFYLGKELMLDRWMSQLIGYLPRKDIMSGQCDAA